VTSSVTLLRTAAVIALLQFVAHTSIFVFSTPMVLKFFFFVPLVPDLAIATCLGGALLCRRRSEVALG
jgi:hypothetical protein